MRSDENGAPRPRSGGHWHNRAAVRLLSRLKRSTDRPDLTAAGPSELRASGYAVVDLETTGLGPSQERILELGIVCVGPSGEVWSEWASRFNPEGRMGATHVHGITAEDVAEAPRFRDRVGEIVGLLRGRVLVAHNAVFDVAFLRAEFNRAGWALPEAPAFCTLQASWYYLPDLHGRRLPQCCLAAGIRARSQHVALDDARATAALLRWYLDPTVPPPPLAEHVTLPQLAMGVAWPAGPSSTQPRHTAAPVIVSVPRQRAAVINLGPTLVSTLRAYSLEQALEEGAPAGSATYLQLLLEVLEDGVITVDESFALAELAGEYGLAPSDVAAAHRGFLTAVARKAVDDDHVTRHERHELRIIAKLLDLPDSFVPAALSQARDDRAASLGEDVSPLPNDWPLGEPLRMGDRVAITGCVAYGRQALEQRATDRGITVSGGVSRTTSLLVSDATVVGTKARAAAEFGVRVVHPDEFEQLLNHVQPAIPRPATQHSRPGATRDSGRRGPSRAIDPSLVRQWARANGITVGTRGRIHQDVFDAYLRANPPAEPSEGAR
jgi:DNA polymerase III subunit epsilon